MNILLGADPELFLSEHGKFVSAHQVIPGTKKNPFPVKLGAVQVDGMAVEFNISPAASESQWVTNVDTVLRELRRMVPENLDINITATADFDERYMEAQPMEAKMLGCDPDFCAYTGEPNPAPSLHPTMRTAAGHIHVGWTEGMDVGNPNHIYSCMVLAIQLDYALGLPSIIHDPDTRRREMYGMPGSFRPKSYGMEYRVLSNFWLNSVQLMREVYNNTIFAHQSLTGGINFDAYTQNKMNVTAKTIIEQNDVPMAMRVCNMLNIQYRGR